MINSLKINKIQDLPVHKSSFIRQFNDSDLPVILHIERATQLTPWSEQNFKNSLQHGHICRALLKNNEIIGFIVFSLQAAECEILNLCIKPNEQNKGYGFKLLQETLQYAKSHNTDIAFLEVRCSNEAAINLYSKVGFNELGVKKSYYPLKNKCEDAIIFALDLTSH
jgi:ribosomal-protein-alanine N-acetyltransferase